MASEPRSTRTRGASVTLPSHTKRPSQANAPPSSTKSPHVADPFLQDFLESSFDPADYLNQALPTLQTGRGSSGVPLSDVSTRAQTTLSQLNAHTTRLTNTLTQLTDDILRSGSRLAYEVELLRGETLSLAEALTETLDQDVAKFVPKGLKTEPAPSKQATTAVDGTPGTHQRRVSVAVPPAPAASADSEHAGADKADASKAPDAPEEPSYITRLRTLTLVRTRLESVIKIFGDAMEFVYPPSELSVSSSFLSVSAPDAGGQNHSTEEKGQQVLQGLRDEISGLLKNQDPVQGIEKAALRIEELKELTKVWKGTAEEKGRAKFIESLAKMVEDRHRELMKELEQPSRTKAASGASTDRKKSAEEEEALTGNKAYGAYGLISQLQKLRGGL